MKIISFFSLAVCQAVAFAPVPRTNLPSALPDTRLAASAPSEEWHALVARGNDSSSRVDHVGTSSAHVETAAFMGFSSSLLSFVGPALAEVDMDDVEIAELPPVWVPILFAIAIIGGVGLLTGSLGDVMSDEASLGMLSGAQAKKEMERSRSSYFKKK